ncbi:MAG: TIGR02266 family protein [Kofleriaceae bacterium]|nr:TIGR02266 family protein [Kofleriaceae bacterium]
MVDSNTRTEKRTPVTLKIKFKSETIEEFIERYAVDVSKGGIFVRTKDPLAVGTSMKFEFQLKDTTPLIGGEGTVVWTRENDPTRPNIAPGMGVRFDRLSDGSQAVLDRILADKAKNGSARGADTKPPVFIDTPTRVGLPTAESLADQAARQGPAGGFYMDEPTRVADAVSADLIESSRPNKITRPAPLSSTTSDFAGTRKEKTPVPSPMRFQTDSNDFGEGSFEEATKIRSLDELAQATLAGEAPVVPQANTPLNKPTATKSSPGFAVPAATVPARRISGTTSAITPSTSVAGFDQHHSDFADEASEISAVSQRTSGQMAARSEGSGRFMAADALASDSGRAQPKLLDTSPSPRPETRGKSSSVAPDSFASAPSGVTSAIASNNAIPAFAPEPMPAGKKSSNGATIVIAGLAVAAAAAASVWFLVLRDSNKPSDQPGTKPAVASGSAGSTQPALTPNGLGSNGSAGSAAAAVAAGSNSTADAGSGSAPITAPAELLTTVVTSKGDNAVEIEVLGTDQKGPSPLSAKLEKGKTYTIRATAPGFKTTEIEVLGGTATARADIEIKPRVVKVDSAPAGAAITIDGVATGKVTPSELALKGGAGIVRITLQKAGFASTNVTVPSSAFTEEVDRMLATASGTLQPVRRPQTGNRPNPGRGTGTGTDANTGNGAGSDTGADSGSGTDTTTPDVKPDVKPEPTPDDKPSTGPGAAGSGEPQPTWLK